MKAIVIEPGKTGEVREIDGSLASLQACVGGLIERVQWQGRYTVYVNEEGFLQGLAPNRGFSKTLDARLYPDGVVGPAVIVKKKGLSDADVADVLRRLNGERVAGRGLEAGRPSDRGRWTPVLVAHREGVGQDRRLFAGAAQQWLLDAQGHGRVDGSLLLRLSAAPAGRLGGRRRDRARMAAERAAISPGRTGAAGSVMSRASADAVNRAGDVARELHVPPRERRREVTRIYDAPLDDAAIARCLVKARAYRRKKT